MSALKLGNITFNLEVESEWDEDRTIDRCRAVIKMCLYDESIKDYGDHVETEVVLFEGPWGDDTELRTAEKAMREFSQRLMLLFTQSNPLPS